MAVAAEGWENLFVEQVAQKNTNFFFFCFKCKGIKELEVINL